MTPSTKKPKTKMANILSKHLKNLKQTDEQKQRNSFNQFWLEGSTHKERQDQLPSDDRERTHITSLGSYVSNLVIKGLLASATPIQPPHIENYSSCVLFADISGFTSLTERLGNHGKEGVELLTRNLNRYFEMLIKIVRGYGGDVVKFAGDAVLTHWPTHGELINRVRIACECALALQTQLHNFPVPGGFLTLHIGIGCGNISGLYVGGAEQKVDGGSTSQKVEFLIAGDALQQATLCEKEAESGEIYISPATLDVVRQYASVAQRKGKINYKLDAMVLLDNSNKRDNRLDDHRKFLMELPLLMDMRDSLQRFVPAAVINQLRPGGAAYPGELRHLTVIFVSLSHGVPDPVSDLPKLQRIVVAMQESVYKYEGTVRQFMIDDKGAVLVAAWGVPPYSHEDDPSRAVEAAMEIVVALFKLTVISTVGVTTGKCFCGDVGSDERREYAVVGDVVNLSARLMGHSQGGVLVDEETSRQAKKIEFIKLSDPIKVKGKVASIAVYKPLKRLADPNQAPSPRATAMRSRGMIGRHMQLREIAHLVDDLRNGAATRVVLIEAEAGLGKSRLLSELKYSFCMGLRVFKAAGIQMNSSLNFYVWKALMSDYLKAAALDEYAELRELGPHVAMLNGLLDIRVIVPDPNRRHSAPQRAETLQMLMLRLAQIAVPAGSIVIIDDAHFMDSASWTLTLNCARQLDNCLIIIAQRPTREGVPHAFTQLPNLSTISLEPLQTRDEAALLVEQILETVDPTSLPANHKSPRKVERLPDEIVDELFTRSQGNHFVIEEMVAGLRASGLLDAKREEAIEHVRVSMPRTVIALITSRIDRLSTTQQLELKVAAVIGMPFTVDSLFRLLPADTTTRAGLAADLDALEAAHFIKAKAGQPEGESLYSFQHTRTQEVIYELMLFSQRRELHSKIAKILELTCTPQNSLYISLVHHYHSAQDYAKAFEYSTKAGVNALADNNNKEAVKFFQLALKCTEHEMAAAAASEDEDAKGAPGASTNKPTRKLHRRSSSSNFQSNTINVGPNPLKKVPLEVVSITRKLGLALFNMGLLQTAAQQLLAGLKHLGIEMPPIAPIERPAPNAPVEKRAAKLVRTLKPPRQDSLTKFFTAALDMFEKREAILCLVILAKIYLHDCSRAASSWCSFVALQLATDNWGLQSEAFSIGIRALGANGDNTTPLKYYAAILSRSDETNGYVYGNAHQSWAVYMAGLGRWDEAEAGCLRASEAASKTGDKKLQEESGLFLSTCLALMGQLPASLSLARKTLESSRVRGDVQLQIMALNSAANALFHLGEFAECATLISEIEALYGVTGLGELTASTQANLAVLQSQMALQRGDYLAAHEACCKVANTLARCEPNNFTMHEAYASLPLMLIKLLQHQTLTMTPTVHTKITNDIAEAMALLDKFADVFPIGQPRALLLKGVVMIVVGKDLNGAEEIIQESKEKAVKLSMSLEEAISAYYLNLYFSEFDPTTRLITEPASTSAEQLQHLLLDSQSTSLPTTTSTSSISTTTTSTTTTTTSPPSTTAPTLSPKPEKKQKDGFKLFRYKA
eukprot:gene6580-7636_t